MWRDALWDPVYFGAWLFPVDSMKIRCLLCGSTCAKLMYITVFGGKNISNKMFYCCSPPLWLQAMYSGTQNANSSHGHI